MAATTTKVTQLEFKLSNTKTASIKLPEPINMTLTDPDTGDSILPSVMPSIAAVFQSDDGASIASTTVKIIQTTTTPIVEDYVIA